MHRQSRGAEEGAEPGPIATDAGLKSKEDLVTDKRNFR